MKTRTGPLFYVDKPPSAIRHPVKVKIDVHWKKWTRDSPKWRIEAWEEDALV